MSILAKVFANKYKAYFQFLLCELRFLVLRLPSLVFTLVLFYVFILSTFAFFILSEGWQKYIIYLDFIDLFVFLALSFHSTFVFVQSRVANRVLLQGLVFPGRIFLKVFIQTLVDSVFLVIFFFLARLVLQKTQNATLGGGFIYFSISSMPIFVSMINIFVNIHDKNKGIDLLKKIFCVVVFIAYNTCLFVAIANFSWVSQHIIAIIIANIVLLSMMCFFLARVVLFSIKNMDNK